MVQKRVVKADFLKLNSADERKHYRVAVFGSARIKSTSPYYKEVVKLGEMIGTAGIDIVTGGGPGIMEAACVGHEKGKKKTHNGDIHEFGLTIKLPKEQRDNGHFDMKKDFRQFSKRLDYFVQLSDAVVVATGGVGTLLELLYTWQLIQVEHIYNIPIILMGDQWPHLIDWIKKGPLKHNLLNKEDLDSLYVVKDAEEAFKIIRISYETFKKARQKHRINSNPTK